MQSNKTKSLKPNLTNSKGFTLIEMIIGIVVFAISLAIVVQYFGPAEKNSADQIHQIKASELGQGLLDDIMSRSFDENSDRSGGVVRCFSNSSSNSDNDEFCKAEVDFGPDAGESEVSLYDDVDDFHQLTENDLDLDTSYSSFKVNVTVKYDAQSLYLSNYVVKKIFIIITTPLGTEIAFTIVKANF